jgi:hypothetical protein
MSPAIGPFDQGSPLNQISQYHWPPISVEGPKGVPRQTVAQDGTVSSVDEQKPFTIKRPRYRPCQSAPSLDTETAGDLAHPAHRMAKLSPRLGSAFA